MRSKAQKNKKREAKKKLNVQKKSKKASYAPPPPKRSIARDYANVGKPFRNPKKSKQKRTDDRSLERVCQSKFI